MVLTGPDPAPDMRAPIGPQASNVGHVLVILTRLRQLCDHPALFMTGDDMQSALANPEGFMQEDHKATEDAQLMEREEVRESAASGWPLVPSPWLRQRSPRSTVPVRGTQLRKLLRDNEIEDCAHCLQPMRVPSITAVRTTGCLGTLALCAHCGALALGGGGVGWATS